ncbi:MAG: GreA/GreB family elongation factor [Candidatus Aenigmarchaeota archaeon]|nr:GreA/GreB family elongation factor [Candidatus Aenigmarchaeota archaeon]
MSYSKLTPGEKENVVLENIYYRHPDISLLLELVEGNQKQVKNTITRLRKGGLIEWGPADGPYDLTSYGLARVAQIDPGHLTYRVQRKVPRRNVPARRTTGSAFNVYGDPGDMPEAFPTYENVVRVGMTVHIREVGSGGEHMYTIVNGQANLEQGKISKTSPVGSSLLGKRVGDEVDVNAPKGNIRYVIESIDGMTS